MSKRRPRTCRRCRQDYEQTEPLQKICGECRGRCSSCDVTLTDDNWDSRGKASGKVFRCKACIAEGVRDAPNRKEWQKEYDLKRNYGITLIEYEELVKNGCEICGIEDNLVVDHCHTSLKVRGCLCSQCNTGLGLFRDDKERMEKAIEYLNVKCQTEGA